MDNKKNISFKCMTYRSFLTFLVLVLSPSISVALTSQLPEQPDLPIETVSQLTPKNLNFYGPVNNNEGLWDIAEKLRLNVHSSRTLTADSEVTIPQIAVALFDENPKAFIKQNINGLLIGSTLIIPDRQQIQKLNKTDAFDLFLQHWDVWQGVKSEIVIPDQTNDNAQPELMTSQSSKEKSPFVISKAITKTKIVATVETKKAVAKEEVPEKLFQTASITPAIAPAILKSANTIPSVTHPITKQKSDNMNNNAIVQVSHFNFYQNLIGAMNWFQSHFKLSNFDTKNIPEQLSSTSVKIILASLLFIVFLVWLSKREESEVIEIKNKQQNKDETNLVNDSTQLTSPSVSQYNALTEENISQLDNYEFQNRTDINPKFEQASPLLEKKEKHSSKNMLEVAFADSITSSCNNFVPENITAEQKIQAETVEKQPTEPCLINSIDEIRFVNKETTNSKIDAFLGATQVETLSDEELSHDFYNIINSNKIDVFIQEFEEVMSNLSSHAPEVSRTPHDLNNLLQYKLSIHFIKALSEMMQATYLKQFSTTIIEFLEDVLDGKTKMTTDTTNRLIIVVSFYSRYIHSIKTQNGGKLKA